jgi:hypothetical protein
LLSEISHELGNYFHKLYYWAEVLREPRAAGADPETALLLERTVRELETFLKTALEFFRPITIAPMTLPVADLAASVRAVLTRHVDPAPLHWEDRGVTGTSGTVAVDPGRFSFVLDGMVRRLQGTETAGIAAAVAIESPDGARVVTVTLTASNAGRGPAPTVGATIEWAVIERIVELHGGAVEVQGESERRVQLQLPIGS